MPDGNEYPRIPARPTTFNGVKMRSRLEAGFAQWLDSEGLDWEYEPECFSSSAGQYLPDFLIRDVLLIRPLLRFDLYVEVKPTADLLECAALLDGRMRAVFDNLPAPTDPQPRYVGHGGALIAVASKAVMDRPGPPRLIVGMREGTNYGMEMVVRPSGGLALAWPYADFMGPWHGEWWKGDDA